MLEMQNKEQQPLMVTIRCTVFNHEHYLRECLEGFVMQKTNFRFEAIVHDDASTDGSAAIIKEYAEKYPDIIKPIYETENQYSKHDGSLGRIMREHTHGKYVAFCEGDDYWTDPLKLQKQVDVLENNPECKICFGITETMTADGKPTGSFFPSSFEHIGNTITLEDFCREQFTHGQWFGHTSTFMSSKSLDDIRNQLLKTVFKDFPYGDITIVLTGFLYGKGYFIKDTMSRYRLNSGGFNTMMKKNTDKAIAVENKLILGMKAFDEYTGFKYHKHLQNRIQRSECIKEYLSGGNNALVYLKPKYWKFAKMLGAKSLVLMILQTVMPGPYYFLKKKLKGH